MTNDIYKDVTIVIPNYNGYEYLNGCLSSLAKQSVTGFKVIVIDSGSKDVSVYMTKRDFIDVNIFPLYENHGFATAVNLGINLTESKYVILLNNDTVCGKHFVENLTKAIDQAPARCYCVAAKMLSMRSVDLPVLDTTGDFYTLPGWSFSRGRGMRSGYKKLGKSVFSACAGAAIYKRELLIRLGEFDESFFAYLEDLDMGLGARFGGYFCLYCKDAVVKHASGASSGGRYSEFRTNLSARNNLFLLYKNMPNWQLALNLPLLLLGILVKYLFFLQKDLGKAYLQGIYDGLSRLGILQRRLPGIKSSVRLQFALIKYTGMAIIEMLDRIALRTRRNS